MIKITSKEIEHLAKISRIKIEHHEQEKLAHEIEAVLEYASSLQKIAAQEKQIVQKTQRENGMRNVMRDDVAVPDNPEILLDQAPQREGNYFVVPRIIKQ